MKKLILVAFLLTTSLVQATHLRGGLISYSRLGCSNTYAITITVFTDTESGVKFGGALGDGLDVLDFGDGTTQIVPETEGQLLPENFKNVGVASFTVLHTYTPGRYKISYREPNRNEGIVNMENSVLTPFAMESFLIVNGSCDAASPTILSPSVFKGSVNDVNTFSLALQDKTGYRLRYTLVTPKKERSVSVDEYYRPEGVSLNSETGLLTWNALGNSPIIGEYSFAVRIDQLDETNTVIGYVVNDFQIILEDYPAATFTLPDLNAPKWSEYQRVYVPNADEKPLTVEAVSGFSTFPRLVLYTENPNVTMSTVDGNSVEKKVLGEITFRNTGPTRPAPYVATVRAFFNETGFFKDLTLLFFTEDTYLPEVVTDVSETGVVWQLYPNPVGDRILFDSDSEKQVEILDAFGRCVWRGVATREVEVTELHAGSYLLRITESGQRKQARFLKK